MNSPTAEQAATPIYSARDRDTDVLFYSGGLWPPADDQLIDMVCARKGRTNLLLMLTTTGGSPDAAYRICRCLQEKCRKGKLILFVSDECVSAGTLIAIGADELILSNCACLGPIDTQLRNREEPGEMVSGLTPTQALATLKTESFKVFEDYYRKLKFGPYYQFSTKSAARVAADMAASLFRPIYEQIDPMRLAENTRALQLAAAYGDRLGTENLKEDALARLVGSYPSHGFVIDRWEAGELFNCVREPDRTEEALAESLESLVEEGRENTRNGRDPVIKFISPEPDCGAVDTSRGECHDEDAARTDTERTGTPGAGRPATGGDGPAASPSQQVSAHSEAGHGKAESTGRPQGELARS